MVGLEARRVWHRLSSVLCGRVTFLNVRGSEAVNSFLKVVLLLILALVVIKLLPLIFSLGWLLVVAVLGFIAMAASAIATLVGGAIVLVAVLSPLWVPVLAIVGVIALIRRGTRRSGGIAA
jgi:hypothetical protein